MNKFMELLPIERYILIGKLIDAMIYDEEAVSRVQKLVEEFEAAGKIKSTFFPEETILEPLNNEENEQRIS